MRLGIAFLVANLLQVGACNNSDSDASKTAGGESSKSKSKSKSKAKAKAKADKPMSLEDFNGPAPGEPKIPRFDEQDQPSGAQDLKPPAPASPLPDVDGAAVAKAVAALDAAAEDKRGELAARAVFELEAARLGSSLAAGFDALANAAPDARAVATAKAIGGNLPILDAVCGGDANAMMRTIATMPADQRGATLWSQCRLARHGLVQPKAAWTSDPGALLLAHMAYVQLKAHGSINEDETKLIAAAAAISGP